MYMCGILAAFGPRASEFTNQNIHKLSHRGPDHSSIHTMNNISIGFTRLSINDQSVLGNQPFFSDKFISVTNGEIFNSNSLATYHKVNYNGASDTGIVASLFEKLNENIIDELDGFYSGLLVNRENGEIFTIRDYIGKKNLFLVKSKELVIITSELKAIPSINEFKQIPKGVCRINVEDFSINLIRSHKNSPLQSNLSLKEVIINAVKKRIPRNDEKFGVFLSGGLDSSIIASIVHKLSKKATYYILGNDQRSVDFNPATELINRIKLPNSKFISLPTNSQLQQLIPTIVRNTESYNPSIISNGICTHLLSEAAHQDGMKIILSGEGADELFCGYHYFDTPTSQWNSIRNNLIKDMYFTELRRVDLVCMANSIEARCPFLDKEVYRFSETLKFEDFYQSSSGEIVNKYVLRNAFVNELPEEILSRRKVSFDVGSGIRKMVVEYLQRNGLLEKEELLNIWKELFDFEPSNQYFHSYPVFDNVISNRKATHR